MLRILIVDGNTTDTNSLHIACGGLATGDNYARVLRELRPDLAIEIIHPADNTSSIRPAIAEFDGVVWTGSALNAYRLTPEVRSQVELARQAMQTQTPIFGSCWGLQIASVAAGGVVAPSRNGREIIVGRNIQLTEAGSTHPMFTGKPRRFDAVAVHTDEVVTRPAAMNVLATNEHSPVQAAEISLGGGFWGTQYHPEYSLQEIAVVMRRYGDRLVKDGTYPTAEARDQAVNELSELGRDPKRSDLTEKYRMDASVLDLGIHRREILNWLTLKVAPGASARTRA